MSAPKNIRRPEVLERLTGCQLEALHEYFRRNKSGEEQSDKTRAAMAAYQRIRRAIVPGVAERSRLCTREARARRTPEQVEADRVRHNERQREKYRASKGGVVRPYNRR